VHAYPLCAIFFFLLVLDDLQGTTAAASLWFLSALVLPGPGHLDFGLFFSDASALLAGAQFGGSVWTVMFPPQRIVTIDHHRLQFRVGTVDH